MSRLEGLPSLVAARDWDEQLSDADLEIKAGDLWVLSWNDTYQGLVLVAAAKHGFILGWPVTLPDEPAFAPALVLDNTPLGSPVLLWPTRETGLGVHLLHRPLGRLLDPRHIQRIAWAMEDGGDPGVPFAQGSATDLNNLAADAELVERWAALCFHTWPSQAPLYLSETRIKSVGGSAARAARSLNLAPPAFRPLWTGVQPVTQEQVAALASDLGVSSLTLLADDPLHAAVERLSDPLFKEPLLALAALRKITEGEARDRARGQYALAARDDTLAVSDTRLLDAIKRAQAGD